MPKISEFLGIIIYMYYREHNPPHFHAFYGEREASIAINPPSLIEGSLPPRVLGLVIEWATLHKQELQEDWAMAKAMQPLQKIAPLE